MSVSWRWSQVGRRWGVAWTPGNCCKKGEDTSMWNPATSTFCPRVVTVTQAYTIYCTHTTNNREKIGGVLYSTCSTTVVRNHGKLESRDNRVGGRYPDCCVGVWYNAGLLNARLWCHALSHQAYGCCLSGKPTVTSFTQQQTRFMKSTYTSYSTVPTNGCIPHVNVCLQDSARTV